MLYKFLALAAGCAKAELLLNVVIACAAVLYSVLNHAIGYILTMTGFLVSVHMQYLHDKYLLKETK